jgi:methylmalonyl-CoA/ethylmalonyl-CoA epimerase
MSSPIVSASTGHRAGIQALHHIGFVVESIAESAERMTRALGGRWDGRLVHDPLQQARVTFVSGARPGDPLIELVEPESDDSHLCAHLRKHGAGLHHLCYEVDALDDQLAASRAAGALIARPPAPAVAFDGRRIAWVYTRDKLLLEYLERHAEHGRSRNP